MGEVSDDDTTRDRVDSVAGDWDEDGFHLRLSGDDGEYDLRITDVPAARALVEAADTLRDWVAEHDRELAAYEAASPEERRRVLFGLTAVEVEVLADDGRTVIDDMLGHDDSAGSPHHNRKV